MCISRTALNRIFILFLLVTCIYGATFDNINYRFAGVVTEVKVLSIDDQDNILLWVAANKNYYVNGHHHIPNIYIGDSLFEYWENYQEVGVGTHNNVVIYKTQPEKFIFNP